MPLPITIIGGYLGSGKTTLVNHLLRHAGGLRLAILVNEFGALPIDQDLIEAQDEDIISIAGGCVCCSYGNDLTMALLDLQKLIPAPDHVVLEASGVALPGAIAASTTLLPGYALDGTVVVVNGETIRKQADDAYIGDTISRQLGDADLIVLNKTDLIADGINPLQTWLGQHAPDAEIVPAVHGQLPGEIILQSFLTSRHSAPDLSPGPFSRTGSEPLAKPGAHHHDHVADLFTTVSLSVDQPVDPENLAEALAAEESGIVRAKGFVIDPDGDTKTIQTVGRRWTISDAPDGVKTGLVAIGPKNRIDQKKLEKLMGFHQI